MERKIYDGMRKSVADRITANNYTAMKGHAITDNAGLYWQLGGAALILSGEGAMPDYDTDSPPPWYSGRENIHAVDMQTSGLTNIGARAFYDCTRLAAIHLPEGVTKIGDRAFYGCENLAAVHLPKGVTAVGDRAFFGCESLAAIHLPEGMTAVGSGAFAACTGLAAVDLPEGVTGIGKAAFFACTSLAAIHLPASVTEIGRWAFTNCTSLAAVRLPEGVRAVGEWTFENCVSLVTADLPASVTEIGDSAFRRCLKLKEITVHRTNPSEVSFGEYVFTGSNPDSITLYVPGGTKREYQSHPVWKKFRIVERAAP
jgi:hypothetical protein